MLMHHFREIRFLNKVLFAFRDLSRGQISDIEKKDLEAYKNLHFL